jgi:hypothetical protein
MQIIKFKFNIYGAKLIKIKNSYYYNEVIIIY